MYQSVYKVLSNESLSCIVFIYIFHCHAVFAEIDDVLTTLNLVLINILEIYCRGKILKKVKYGADGCGSDCDKDDG